MHRFARVVLGYHGCLEPLATKLLSGKLDVFRWPSSENRWDWLGSGIYFWEHGPSRALRWAEDKARRSGGRPAVVGAVIQLGRCFDLTDVTHTELLGKAYEQVTRFYRARGKRLPCNEGADRDRKKRELDCLMINWCLAIAQVNGVEYQTVRGVFLEGAPVYRGAMIRTESHIQIAVRDPSLNPRRVPAYAVAWIEDGRVEGSRVTHHGRSGKDRRRAVPRPRVRQDGRDGPH